MAKGKHLSSDKKSEISKLFHESNLSVGRIADRLGISPRTVHNYKNYDGMSDLNKSPSESIIDNNDPYIDAPDTSYDGSEEIDSVDQEKHGGSVLILPILFIVCIIVLVVVLLGRITGLFGESEDDSNLGNVSPVLY